jgi:hemerythrin-like domain-containing protein
MIRKPIKRNEHIRKLSQEHHFCLLFCWKVRQGVKKEIAPDRIWRYVQYFWHGHLRPHFKSEEKILFAPLRDNQVERAIREHKQIDQFISEMERQSAFIGRKSLAELATMVDAHVRYEEGQLFPHLERNLTTQQLEKIGELIQKSTPVILQDQYADQFWNN